MLTAFSRMIGLSKDDNSSQSMVELQTQLKGLEQNATTLDILRRTNRRSGILGTIGAVGGGVGSYFLSTVTVAALVAPVTAAAAGAAVGALALGVGYRMWARTPKTNHQNIVKKINAISKQLVDSKIKALADANAGEKIDFVLNRLSQVEEEVTETDKKPVGLVTLNKSLIKDLLSALRKISKHNPIVKIKTIDISSAALSKREMTNLLAAGLGKHETEHLILSNDKHSEDMVKLLKTHIVGRRTAFQNLQRLDLSGNEIDAACLQPIREIVSYLQLKELNLSNNSDLAKKPVEGIKAPLSEILTDMRKPLVSLRKLSLANTGLVEDQAQDVANFVEQAVFLEELNIDRNDGLNLEEVESKIKDKGALKSVSLKKLLTEYDELLSMDEAFAERDNVLRKITTSKKPNESMAIFLLNYKLIHKSFPVDVAEYLEGTVFNKVSIEEVIEKIQIKRSEHLGVQEKRTESITESELIAYYEDKLPELYQKVRDKKSGTLVDPKLVLQIDETKSKVTEVNLDAKAPVTYKTKPRAAKSQGKVTPVKSQTPAKVPAKPQPVVKSPSAINLPNAPITTQFNSARAAKLHADLNATLDADQLERNPGLAKINARI